ncbi:MAG: hypothetical protein ACLPXB_10915 [Thiobacillaceae bacterium]
MTHLGIADEVGKKTQARLRALRQTLLRILAVDLDGFEAVEDHPAHNAGGAALMSTLSAHGVDRSQDVNVAFFRY